MRPLMMESMTWVAFVASSGLYPDFQRWLIASSTILHPSSAPSPLCRYGLSADVYSFGITIIEVALGHTPYMDMSFRQIVTKKAANAGQPMLAVNTHGKQFSQVVIRHPAASISQSSCFMRLQHRRPRVGDEPDVSRLSPVKHKP